MYIVSKDANKIPTLKFLHVLCKFVEGGNYSTINKGVGEGDLTLDKTKFSILTAFFELQSPKLVRSVPGG